jgi:hypothetical protein
MSCARPIAVVAVMTLVGLSLGASFAHVLEMPAKLSLGADDYRTVQGIYRTFGPVAAFLEPAAILGTAGLALAARNRASFRYVVVAGALSCAALLSWVVLVSPMNTAMAHWPDGMPADWEAVRARWEWGHVVGFVVKLGAFIVLARGLALDPAPNAR